VCMHLGYSDLNRWIMCLIITVIKSWCKRSRSGYFMVIIMHSYMVDICTRLRVNLSSVDAMSLRKSFQHTLNSLAKPKLKVSFMDEQFANALGVSSYGSLKAQLSSGFEFSFDNVNLVELLRRNQMHSSLPSCPIVYLQLYANLLGLKQLWAIEILGMMLSMIDFVENTTWLLKNDPVYQANVFVRSETWDSENFDIISTYGGRYGVIGDEEFHLLMRHHSSRELAVLQSQMDSAEHPYDAGLSWMSEAFESNKTIFKFVRGCMVSPFLKRMLAPVLELLDTSFSFAAFAGALMDCSDYHTVRNRKLTRYVYHLFPEAGVIVGMDGYDACLIDRPPSWWRKIISGECEIDTLEEIRDLDKDADMFFLSEKTSVNVRDWEQVSECVMSLYEKKALV